jgi:hypothetical protein
VNREHITLDNVYYVYEPAQSTLLRALRAWFSSARFSPDVLKAREAKEAETCRRSCSLLPALSTT